MRLPLDAESIAFNSQHDKYYVAPDHPNKNQDAWHTWFDPYKPNPGALVYFCPVGWRRFALSSQPSSGFFNKSSILYHGTAAETVPKILNDGLKPNKCLPIHGRKAVGVYLTPSIRYAAHPRYSRVYSDAQGCY